MSNPLAAKSCDDHHPDFRLLVESVPDLYFRIDAQETILDFYQGQLTASQDLYGSPYLFVA